MRSDLQKTREFYSPPKSVTVNGVAYPINWDFETAFRFTEYVDRSQDDDEAFLETVLTIWYPTVPEDRDAALEAAITFYCGGTPPKEGYYTPAVPTDGRRAEFYYLFLRRYGIDLNREPLHWWVFRRLAATLQTERRGVWTDGFCKPSPNGNFSL